MFVLKDLSETRQLTHDYCIGTLTLVNPLHGGLGCRVITAEYISRVH